MKWRERGRKITITSHEIGTAQLPDISTSDTVLNRVVRVGRRRKLAIRGTDGTTSQSIDTREAADQTQNRHDNALLSK